MKTRVFAAGIFAGLALVSPAKADLVTEWSAHAFAVIAADRMGGGIGPARAATILHFALFDAANGVERRYVPYRSALPEAAGASPEAAAHSAARRVLVELFPRQKNMVERHFDAAMAKIPEGMGRAMGSAIGEKVALAIIAERKADGFSGADIYRPVTSPGVYVATAAIVGSHLPLSKPFALRAVSQFRPGPPPDLKSTQWARDYNETKELGGANSTKRTAWQTETGQFWVLIGAHAWNEAARNISANHPLALIESLRAFALMNMAISDSYLAIFDAKHHYNFWRPVTAIRNGDQDGNDATERDAGWTPLIATPLHPEYPCAHCVVDGGAGTVLKSFFGSGPLREFTLTYEAMPGVTRKYTSIQQLKDEVFMARIWGGVHYRTSNEVGVTIGEKVGAYIVENFLKPGL
jgi:hypothetical protein